MLLTLILGLVAGLANVLGGALVVASRRTSQRFLKFCIAFGAGFLLAAAFLKMIPISLEHSAWAPGFVLLGYLVIHYFEHTVTRHFHFGEEIHLEEVGLHRNITLSAFAGLSIHALFDGVSIGSGFLVSPSLGFLIFTAIILHKLPEGFTMASITLAGGGSRRQALLFCLFLGLATLLGAVSVGLLKPFFPYALALSAGVAVYVAASDLIPEVNQERGVWMSIMVFLGVALFYITEFMLQKLGL